jgi:putative ABC transport system permease protein
MEIRPILSSLLRNKTGALLIALQVALTLAIVSNALYIVRERMTLSARPTGVGDESTFFNIRTIPLGQDKDYFNKQKRDEAALRAVPGIVSASWTNQTPLGRSGWNMGLQTSPDAKSETSVGAAFYMLPNPVVPSFGLKLVEGRDFTAQDVIEWDPDANNVLGNTAIVTQALAKQLFPDASAVGKSVWIDDNELHIVGVVERLQSPWAQTSEKAEYALISAVRLGDAYSVFAVRTEPGQLDRAMRDAEAALLKADPNRLVLGKTSLHESRADRYRDDRAVAWMLVTVTALLLLVTASGIIGMATLWVNQRRKQIGVRRALGARRVDILRYFLVENVLITTGGVVAGLVLAMALNQLLVSQLELTRLPLGYLAIGSAVLWVLGLVAVYGPAWRASSTAPAIATRSA